MLSTGPAKAKEVEPKPQRHAAFPSQNSCLTQKPPPRHGMQRFKPSRNNLRPLRDTEVFEIENSLSGRLAGEQVLAQHLEYTSPPGNGFCPSGVCAHEYALGCDRTSPTNRKTRGTTCLSSAYSAYVDDQPWRRIACGRTSVDCPDLLRHFSSSHWSRCALLPTASLVGYGLRPCPPVQAPLDPQSAPPSAGPSSLQQRKPFRSGPPEWCLTTPAGADP